jgi:urea carboxylase/allophanate hydrolase
VHIEDGVLDLAAHEAWADVHRQDIVATAAQRARAINAAPFLDQLIHTREDPDAADGGHGYYEAADEDGGDGCERVKAGIPGRCWKVLVREADKLEAGSVLVSFRLSLALHLVFLFPSFLSFLVHRTC